MSSGMREVREQVERAKNRVQRLLTEAQAKALAGKVSVNSPKQTVRVEVGGDLRLRALEIRRDRGSEDLAAAIRDGYNKALITMQQAQWRLFRDALRYKD